MLGEISLAAGMLGKIWDMAHSGKKSGGIAGQGSGEFAALVGMGAGQTGLAASGAVQGATMGATDGVDAGTKEALNMLHDFTSGGLEGAMRAAMKKMREKVMQEMGVTPESLAAMDPKSRMAMEDSISKEVMRRMQAAMGVEPGGKVDPNKLVDFSARLLEAAKAYKNDTPMV